MFKHYFAAALHNFRRYWAMTAVNVLALTIGFAAFMTGYAVVKYWSMSDRQFVDANRIYAVTEDITYRGATRLGAQPRTAFHVAKYLRADFPELSAVARQAEWGSLPVSDAEKTFSLRIGGVEPDFLKIFHMQSGGPPADALAAPLSVVLTTETAKRFFGSNSAVGKTLRLNNQFDLHVTG